ncbi:MAG TPA: hypothetical protein VFG35_21655, partial [Actinoplanes sp.]|nr:hypothetical protein [Actinoplanes sp.]
GHELWRGSKPVCDARSRPGDPAHDLRAQRWVTTGSAWSERRGRTRPMAHLADLRARSGLTTEQLIYSGRARGWLMVPSLEPS